MLILFGLVQHGWLRLRALASAAVIFYPRLSGRTTSLMGQRPHVNIVSFNEEFTMAEVTDSSMQRQALHFAALSNPFSLSQFSTGQTMMEASYV